MRTHIIGVPDKMVCECSLMEGIANTMSTLICDSDKQEAAASVVMKDLNTAPM